MPNSVESQAWLPSSQACWVGLLVGVPVGVEDVGSSVGAKVVGMLVGDVVIGDLLGELVGELVGWAVGDIVGGNDVKISTFPQPLNRQSQDELMPHTSRAPIAEVAPYALMTHGKLSEQCKVAPRHVPSKQCRLQPNPSAQ